MGVDYSSDYSYANEKLTNSVVRLGKIPVYIYGVNREGVVRYGYLGAVDQTKDCHLKDLNLDPIPVGYVNLNVNSPYLVRTPSRRYKQGLTPQNVRDKTTNRSVNICRREFNNSLMGIYPNLPSCLEEIKCGEVGTKAFSRHFCLGPSSLRGNHLLYKGDKIGHITYKDGGINYILNEGRDYMKELLEDNMNV